MTRILPSDHDHAFATRAIHAGQVPEPLSGAVMTPIYQTSTYVQEGLGKHKGYEYARTQNPTREALERNVASLEGGDPRVRLRLRAWRRSTPCSSCSRPGTTSSAGRTSTAGSHRLMERIYGELRASVHASWTCATSRNVERALTPATRLVYCETPTNPMMELTDLAAVGDLTQAHGSSRGGQHLRHAVLPAAARATAPTSSSTRPPST